MNDESLEAAFKEYWEATYPNTADAVVHSAVRDAFLSGAGHVALTVAGIGYDRGIMAAKRMVDQWSREMDGLVNANPAQRLARRVPDVAGSETPPKA